MELQFQFQNFGICDWNHTFDSCSTDFKIEDLSEVLLRLQIPSATMNYKQLNKWIIIKNMWGRKMEY